MTGTPNVAVVILNYNGQKFLADFLPAVLKTTYSNFDIYLADNSSNDNSVDFVKETFPTVKIIQLDQNHGFANGYNFALEKIKSDYFVLLNSDVEVTPGWIEPIIQLMENDKSVAAVQPKIMMHSNKGLFEHAGGAGGWMDRLGYPFCRGRIFYKLEEDKGQYDDNAEIFWASGASMFVRADLFEKIGGLDGDYFAHMEEIDMCWRLKRAGYKVMVCPKSTVYHVGGGTLPPSNPRKTYLNFRNSLITLMKNEPISKLLWLIPFRLILDGIAGIRFLKEGKFKDIWAILKAHWVFYFTLPATLRKRKASNQRIKTIRIAPNNITGIYQKSIVVQFFLRKKHYFKELF